MREIDGLEIYGVEDVKFEECPFCESCGDLEPYTATLDDGGTTWCMDCVRYNDEVVITDEEENDIEIKEVKAKIKHFEKRIKSLNKKISKLLGVE